MPCTDGGTPVTIDTLFGLVKLGSADSTSAEELRSDQRPQVRRHAGGNRAIDVVERRSVETHHHHRPRRPAIGAAVDRDGADVHQRLGIIALRIFATTVKFGSTTLAISYSAACPIRICAPRSVMP